MTGTLALVGGAEFTSMAEAVDRELVALAPGAPVLVVPTAAAFERPERAVATAVSWFAGLGVAAEGLDLLNRADASRPAVVDRLRASRFTYLAGGSPMHLKSTLKETPAWDALVSSLADGAVLAGSSAGAMAITDPMVDPRGGAFTLGLGLVSSLAVVPHADEWSADLTRRTIGLAKGFTLALLHTGSALLRDGEGRWRSVGTVDLYRNGERIEVGEISSL